MPNRILKESLLYSRDIAQLTEAEEAFFYRLLVCADDHGRFFADPEVVRARCYPRGRAEVTEEVVQGHLSRLVVLGMIQLYEDEGDSFLQIASWLKHQQKRATNSKFPDPEGKYVADDINRKQLQSSDINGKQPQADSLETTRLREARDETTRNDIALAQPARERDPIWDALVVAYGEPPKNQKMRTAWGIATKELRDQEATPESIAARVREGRASKDDWAVKTPTALAKHFNLPLSGTNQPGQRSLEMARKLEGP